MSEFLCCDQCGELSMFSVVVYINDKPVCVSCQKENNLVIQSTRCEVIKR